MSCIVAIIEDGSVVMGADSAGVAGLFVSVRKDPKIFRVGEFLIGYTSSFRMGQILGYSLVPPEHPADMDTARYMATLFVDAVRAALSAGGFARKENETEAGGEFLIGYRGRIFHIHDDYQVGEAVLPYDAVGCGSEIALGSMYSTVGYAEHRVRKALEAAQEFSGGVRAPFLILANGIGLPAK